MTPIIRLVGPGGAGKTTAGRQLAIGLGWIFLDLDEAFIEAHGDIAAFISAQGYVSYACANLALHAQLSSNAQLPTVFALSSGFMTYPDSASPAYSAQRDEVEQDPLTILLMPSFELGACVRVIVERQLARPYLRGDRAAETARLQTRFDALVALRCQRVLSDAAPEEVAQRLQTALVPALRVALTPSA